MRGLIAVVVLICAGIGCANNNAGGTNTNPDGGGSSGVDGGTGTDGGTAGTTILSPAATMVLVTGNVMDTSGAPIAGATVGLTPVSGAMSSSTTTGADGSFRVPGSTGRVRLSVSATGFVPWQQLIPATSQMSALNVRLFASGAPQSVSPAGATVTAGPASLSFPSGAYAAQTTVTASFIGPANIDSMSHRAWWRDDNGQNHRVVGELHVVVSTEPSVPVAVTLPIPAGVTKPMYYPFGADGVLGTAIAPSTTGSGVATFQVPHFDGGTLADDQPMVLGAVLVSGSCSYTPPSGTSTTATIGDLIPSGSAVNPASTVGMDLSDGSRISLSASSFNFTTDGTTGEIDQNGDGAGIAEVPHLANPLPANTPKLRIQIPNRNHLNDVLGVRGTVFSFQRFPCALDPMREITSVEVPEGLVDLTTSEGTASVSGGNGAKECDGCPNPAIPECPSEKCSGSIDMSPTCAGASYPLYSQAVGEHCTSGCDCAISRSIPTGPNTSEVAGDCSLTTQTCCHY